MGYYEQQFQGQDTRYKAWQFVKGVLIQFWRYFSDILFQGLRFIVDMFRGLRSGG